MAPKLTGIDHIHVFVSDRLAAEDWYRRVLGLVREPTLESWASGGGPLTKHGAIKATLHGTRPGTASPPTES
jgi:catechol 2,3-dioxygenase-like lactoylglutathione lyase family enzyme